MKCCSPTLKKATIGLIALIGGFLVLMSQPEEESVLLPFMPELHDYTRQSWVEELPARDENRPSLRVFETGRFAFALNTETLAVPHFGAIEVLPSYAGSARTPNNSWQALPPADLDLEITVDDETYRASAGSEWGRHSGPRLVEAGRFFQRSDVTDLTFTSEKGTELNIETRFETTAWSDRLGLILAARPGALPVPAGEPCFGIIGGGFGLDGSNEFIIPHQPEFDSEHFTLDFRAFIPTEYKDATEASPWLVCKSLNENVDGNYGITLSGGKAAALMNVGGGLENRVVISSSRDFKLNAWNHFSLSYDGQKLTFYQNGQAEGEAAVGKPRTLESRPLVFGRRADDHGDGRHFTGIIDEVHYYDRALNSRQAIHKFHHPDKDLPNLPPTLRWDFDPEGKPSETMPLETWNEAAMEITFRSGEHTVSKKEVLKEASSWSSEWRELGLSIDPLSVSPPDNSPILVSASEDPTGRNLTVDYDPARSWHRIDLNGVKPIVPEGENPERQNDALERIKLTLTNPADIEETARLLFAKSARGFEHRFGFPITGMSAILRDADGEPTGIPVQLSKNWHNSDEAGVYSGTWFHGFSQLRLPPQSSLELELTIAYGHWGGLPAASHAQLSLIGWGTNQRWDQSALGSWGENICYEPGQFQGMSTITDVRPVLVKDKSKGGKYAWTVNVGGGDFFRWFDRAGVRSRHSNMKATYLRHGPCLTEATYTGNVTGGVTHSTTVSLGRTDDLVRGTYRIRLDVTEPSDFSRFVIFQIGADTYSSTGEKRMAIGDETGVIKEWPTQWGGDTYRTEPFECSGRIPWMSLHESVPRLKPEDKGAWANRGVVIRSWNAKLGGKDAAPWVAERGVNARGTATSTLDIIPPPEVTRLEPGDFVEATIEHLVVPQFAADYYGPNRELQLALSEHENTAQMILREASGNDRDVTVSRGELLELHPAVTVKTKKGRADLTLTGGLGYVPVTFTGLNSPTGWDLAINDKPLDQSVHGNDFWQTDFDTATKTWSLTYNIPTDGSKPHEISLRSR